MAGKHRAPSTTKKTLFKFSTVALAAASPVVFTPSIAEASASQDSILAAIASCESGNRNIPTGITDRNGRRLSTASGYWQIVNGTWRAHGGTQFASTAIQASYEQQLVIARNILNGQGIGAWSESKSCWSKRIGKVPVKAPTNITPAKPVKEKKEAAPAKKKVDEKPKTSAPKQAKQRVIAPPTHNTTAERAATSYVIKRGDTLTRIARRNGTTVKRLANLNRATIKNVDLIYAGNSLRLR